MTIDGPMVCAGAPAPAAGPEPGPAPDDDTRDALLGRIDARQRALVDYLDRTRGRSGRLTVISIVSSAFGAVFAAVPAVGGSDLTDTVQQSLGLDQGSTVWRALCLLALAASLSAAISANLVRVRNYAARIGAVEVCHAELDSLRTQLEFTGTTVADAARSFDAASAKVSFVVPGADE